MEKEKQSSLGKWLCIFCLLWLRLAAWVCGAAVGGLFSARIWSCFKSWFGFLDYDDDLN
ncbi:MAG: hypothetical protein NC548_65665 [Lachnospiraceae bacterium]|nr:hypothetical protein [Lachnospiraceae bacterium]